MRQQPVRPPTQLVYASTKTIRIYRLPNYIFKKFSWQSLVPLLIGKEQILVLCKVDFLGLLNVTSFFHRLNAKHKSLKTTPIVNIHQKHMLWTSEKVAFNWRNEMSLI